MDENIPAICRRGLLRSLLAIPVLGSLPGAAFGGTGQSETGLSMIEQIGEIVSLAKAGDLTPQTRERVTACIVDNLATLTFTAQAAKGDPYLERIVRRSGLRESVILGTGKRAPVEDAAGAQAYLIHYAETDDSDFRAELRASPIVMGPAFAVAQGFGATRDDMYAAIAAGYTVLGGLAAPFGALQPYGLMSSGFWGAAAAAAVAARMMKLSPTQTSHAISLALSSAGGTFQYFYDQTEEKRLILGRAARAGVESALLAADGEHGASNILEGKAGIYALLRRLVDREPDISGVVEAVRQLDGPMYIYPKFYSASSSITPTLEALHPLVSSGLDVDAVEAVIMRADPVVWEPLKAKLVSFKAPETLIGAKINYAYMTAFFLVNGAADAGTVGKAELADERVLRLAERIRFEPISGEQMYVAVVMKDGTQKEFEVPNQRPGNTAPLAADLRAAKFRVMTEPVLGKQGSANLLSLAEQGAGPTEAKDWISRLDKAMRP